MLEGSTPNQRQIERQALTDQVNAYMEKRRHQRFKLNVEIKVYSQCLGLLTGETVDISESGISAILKGEVPVGKVVTVEFTLTLGFISVPAVVRQRNAFRHGFEFLDATTIREIIRRSCDGLVPCG